MKKHEFSNFGFSTIMLTFAMICIVTFSALAYVTANSDYKLSSRVAQNDSAYYSAEEDMYEHISQIDKMLAMAYSSSSDKDSYFDAVRDYLSSDSGLAEDENGLTYSISKEVTDNQTLNVELSITYPAHQSDGFYKISKWKLSTDTSVDDTNTFNLIGGN